MSEKSSMSTRPLKWMLLGPFMALLFLGHCFADNCDHGIGRKGRVARGQPVQMRSRVHYDPTLTGPVFGSDEWKYPDYIQEHSNGDFEDMRSRKRVKDPPRLRYTAKCVSTSYGSKHPVRFCEVRLIDGNMIDLFINDFNPGNADALRVQIKNGMFTCHYWTVFKIMTLTEARMRWTTTHQKLTLDKKDYRNGDSIKGRIDFECVQEPTNPKFIARRGRCREVIKVYGMFKTIVE